jgi:predicted membrane protein
MPLVYLLRYFKYKSFHLKAIIIILLMTLFYLVSHVYKRHMKKCNILALFFCIFCLQRSTTILDAYGIIITKYCYIYSKEHMGKV